jgi:hypothetical protein
MDRQLPKLGVV